MSSPKSVYETRAAYNARVASEPPPPADLCCEQHPEKDWPHDDCAGPGMPISERMNALVYQRDYARSEARLLREGPQNELEA